MVNTLNNLLPTIYEAVDVVSRELVGFIPSVARDMTLERAAVGQTVTSPISPASTANDITPGVTAPNQGDQVFGNFQMTMTKSRAVPFRWTGEQNRHINNGGIGRATLQRDQITQAIRTLVNEMETDLAVCAALNASRAWGTPGATPFATTLGDPAQVRKILDDNGAPASGRSLIIDTTAGAALRTLSQLTKNNEAGTTETLRQGTLLDIHGMMIKESAKVQTPVKGTGAGYTSNTAGYAIGATAITLITGTGTVLQGDVVTFAGDSNKYVVAAGGGVAAPGVITLAAPGLRQALPASAVAMTIQNAATRNTVFTQNALLLATRAPALPDEGDMADDRIMVQDPVSGLALEISLYKQYRQVYYEVACTWGVAAPKPEHIAHLLG